MSFKPNREIRDESTRSCLESNPGVHTVTNSRLAPANRAKALHAGVSFWTLLDEVRVGYTDGRLGLGRLYAVCLPAPAKQSTSNYPYDPDGGGKLSTLVKTADGKVLNTFVWIVTSSKARGTTTATSIISATIRNPV